jgi:signal transduction histidine kinase
VRLGLAVADGKLVINIEDNGQGFINGKAHPAGNGINNMKQRLEQIGGRLGLETRLGKGTSIRIEIKGG